MDNNTKEVIEQFGTKLDSYIQVLAEKLGVAAEYVYPLFVKQQVIEGIWFFSAVAFFIFVGVIMFVLGFKKGKKVDWKDGLYYALLIPGGLIIFATLMVLSAGGSKNLTKIINPEYAAIKEIIQMVK